MALNTESTNPQATQPSVVDETRPVRLLKSTTLRGCNVYYGSTVVRQRVNLGGLARLYSGAAGRGFAGRFVDRFLGLETIPPTGHMTKDFLERLNSATGVRFEEALFEAILAVEMSMAFTMHKLDTPGFAEIIRGGSRRTMDFVWECHVPSISRAAARVGLAGFAELLPDTLHPRRTKPTGTFATKLAALRKRAAKRQWSTTTAVLALAAKKRGLPCETLGGAHLRLGHGVAQQFIYASITGNTSFAATKVARNKRRTNRLLKDAGLPVPTQIKAATVEEASNAAETLAYPVVVKPLKGKQASGVTVGVQKLDDVPRAFERARYGRDKVIVESFVAGQTYRLLVVGGRFVAALRFAPPSVTGDGKSTIAQLIDELNSDPLRNSIRLYPIEVNDELKASLGLSGRELDSVLEDGEQFTLYSAANAALGATHTDVTETVNPDNQDLAVRATAVIGLDIAGVDFVTPDITRSHKEVGGSIVEMNSRPGLCMHTLPRYGKPRDVSAEVLKLAFPPGATARIPIALIAGEQGTISVARDLDVILRACGKAVGLATRKGSSVCGQPVAPGSMRAQDAVRFLLRDPRVETLVHATSPRRIVQRGLHLDACNVTAILNPVADGDIESYQRGIEVAVRATTGMLVVSAGNTLALDVIGSLDPRRVILLSRRLRDSPIEQHLADGGAAVVRVKQAGDECIELHRASETVVSIPCSSTGSDGKRINARRVLAQTIAVALAFGLGVSGQGIQSATTLRTKSHP